MNIKFLPNLFCAAAIFFVGVTVAQSSEYKFQEVFSLIQSNLAGASPARLNEAAVAGLVSELQPDVRLMTNRGAEINLQHSSLAKTNVFGDSLGYIRFSGITAVSSNDFKGALQNMGKIVGLVLDLRFASGYDYDSAAAIVSQFLPARQPLLKLDDKVLESFGQTDVLNIPLAVLINKQTEGAAEALAAILREMQFGLLIGGNSAGRARVYKDFPLSTGQVLQIAESRVRLANGQELSPAGLSPDLMVNTPLEQEKFYLEDPYATYIQTGGGPSGKDTANRLNITPRRGLNEAELVRRRREGVELESEPNAERPAVKVVKDPSLSRALDFLKGAAVVRLRSAEK